MRIDLPAFGEYPITRPAKPAAHAAKRHAATTLVLPRIAQAVPRQQEQQGDLTTVGFLGQWLIETGNLLESQWNPDKPVQSINAAFDAAVNKALSGKFDLNLGVTIFRPESDNIYLPDCLEDADLDANVLLAVECNYSDVLEVPFLRELWKQNPKLGNQLIGLIDMAFDKNVRCFGASQAWYTASYAYYMGEIEAPTKDFDEHDATVRKWIESEELSEETPLPSALAKVLPTGDFFDAKKRVNGMKKALQGKSGAYEKAIALQQTLAAANARNWNIDAWSVCGAYNYDTAPHFNLSIGDTDSGETDQMVKLFDIFMNDQMNAGNACDIKGLARLNNAVEFAEWLESLTMGCKLAEQALELIESLQ